VDPSTIEQTTEDYGVTVPLVLVQMKDYLFRNKALKQEGIFRLAGDQGEMKRLKQAINKSKDFDSVVGSLYSERNDTQAEDDINTIANLIKVWFREMPAPIMNVIPTQEIYNSSDQEVCVQAYDNMQEPQRSLLSWLLSLLCDVAAKKTRNKMTEQNLAIVVAPNLFIPPGSDPLEGLVMSQKSVQFLHNLLVYEVDKRANKKDADD